MLSRWAISLTPASCKCPDPALVRSLAQASREMITDRWPSPLAFARSEWIDARLRSAPWPDRGKDGDDRECPWASSTIADPTMQPASAKTLDVPAMYDNVLYPT